MYKPTLVNIKAVAQETGIKEVTIRSWERRYGLPDPQRNEAGVPDALRPEAGPPAPGRRALAALAHGGLLVPLEEPGGRAHLTSRASASRSLLSRGLAYTWL